MIKNNAQLTNARERLEYVREKMGKYRATSSGAELDFFLIPLEIEFGELSSEIKEYTQLRDLPFEDALQDTLSAPILLENIGELLSKLRIAAKLTQSDMATRLGWQQANLSRFEGENYSSQTVSKIVEYANALGIWLHVAPSLTERAEHIAQIRKDLQEPRVTVDYASTSISRDYLADLANSSSYGISIVAPQKEPTTV